MGRYAIILIIALIVLFSYFVIASNNSKTNSVIHNVEELSYKQAKNIANSSAQMISRNIMRPDQSDWPDFTKVHLADQYLTGQIIDDFLPEGFIDWPDLNGSYELVKLERVTGSTDLLLVVAGKESFHNTIQQTNVLLRENETTFSIWNYAIYAKTTILMNNPNPYIDSYNSDSPDSLWSFEGEFQNAPVGTDLPYTNPNYPINRIDQIYGPDPEYNVNKYLPPVEMPAGGEPLTIPNTNYTITEGIYRIDGNLSVGGSRVLTIEGDVTLYVTGNFTTSGTATIAIGNVANPNSTLKIYVDGNMDIGGTGFVNNSQVPSNLQIFGTENCISIAFRGTSDTHAAIYAPSAYVDLLGTTNFFGAIVAYEVEIVGTIAFHYDEALGGENAPQIDSTFKYYVVYME